MKSQLVEALTDEGWDLERTNLLLSEFNLPLLSDDWRAPGLGDALAHISDPDLVELYAIVVGIETSEVEDVVESAIDVQGWKAGYIRLFISHSAAHKELVGRVASELAVVGIDGFVAHDTMEYSKPWQAQIEQALRAGMRRDRAP